MEMKFSLILHCVKKVFTLLLDNSDECSGFLENGYTEVTHWAMPSPVSVLVTALHVLCCRALLLFLGCTLFVSPSCLGSWSVSVLKLEDWSPRLRSRSRRTFTVNLKFSLPLFTNPSSSWLLQPLWGELLTGLSISPLLLCYPSVNFPQVRRYGS